MTDQFSLAYSPDEAKKYIAFEEKQHQADALIETALKDLGITDCRVLDYGCGSGHSVPSLLKLRTKEIVGCDPSDAMIREAKRRLAAGELGDASRVKFEVQDTLPTHYGAASFDGILCRFVFHYIVDTAPVLKEFARLLRPNGWLVAIFSDVYVAKGSENLENTSLPLYFLDNLTIQTLVKPGREIVENAKAVGFNIEHYSNPPDTTLVSIPDSYPHKDKIEKFETGFLVARKRK